MVSVKKILGKPSLIFVTVGSTEFPFEALIKSLNKVFRVYGKQSRCLVQCVSGKTVLDQRYGITRRLLTHSLLVNYIRKADRIITHGGPGTIFLCAKYAKVMPLIIPRSERFGEHVDDHQIYFAKYLRGRLPDDLQKYILLDRKNMELQIREYVTLKIPDNKLSVYLFSGDGEKNSLIRKLGNYLHNI